MSEIREVEAQVEEIVPLTDSIVKLILKAQEFVPYQAGQYLQMHWKDQVLSYSIANAPLGSQRYELHIRHTRDNEFVHQVLKSIKETGHVTISLPSGNCYLQALPANDPLVFIAGGTGFSPIKAMIEQLLADDDPRAFYLIWSAKTSSDLYLDELVHSWQNHVSRFCYFSVLTSSSRPSLAAYAQDKLEKKVLNNAAFVISGPFDMVFSTRDELLNLGIAREKLFSDAFDFEKNKEK